MYDRKAIKLKSKAAFKANYWRTFFVTFIITAIAGGTAGSVGSNAANGFAKGGDPSSAIQEAQTQMDNIFAGDPKTTALAIAIVVGILAVAVAIGTAINLFIVQPFKVGACNFYDRNEKSPAGVGEILNGFRNGYMRNVLAMFLAYLFTSIGMILFVIPGILFAFGFRLVPYVLSEHPEMTAMQALKESHRLMKGNRWKLFVFDLSFIGWNILTAITLGLVGTFFALPYQNQANAGFYEAIKQIKDGVNPTVVVEDVTV